MVIFLPKFRGNLSVPSSCFKLLDFLTPRMGPIGCPETSARNDHYWQRNNAAGRSSQLRRGDSLISRKFGTHLPSYLAMLYDLRCQTVSSSESSIQKKINGRQSTFCRRRKYVGYMLTVVMFGCHRMKCDGVWEKCGGSFVT
jgi:hypothetical protein